MKKQATQNSPKSFRLSGKATAKLNNYLAEIRQGIANVCEMHTHDATPSSFTGQAEFEDAYIDWVLAQTVTAVSASIRSMAEVITKQKEASAQAIKDRETKNN